MSNLSLTQKLIAGLNHISDDAVSGDETFSYQVLFLNKVRPDKTNFRYFPAIIINDDDADLYNKRLLTKRQLAEIYKSEGHVLIGKLCFVNCLPYESSDWHKVSKNIASITGLANNISVSDLIQAPTIFPCEDGSYQILTGHRRFFALIYSKGINAPSQFKVYNKPPLFQKVKQFQENSSREDLPQYGKLCAFNAAKMEIDALREANKQLGRNSISIKETVAIMGISAGAYDNYNVLIRYPSVMKAYENGLNLPFLKSKKIILQTEQAFKEDHNKSLLNVNDKRTINEEIKKRLYGKKAANPLPDTLKFKKIQSRHTIKKLLTSNLQDLGMEIDWDNIDWNDTTAVKVLMDSVIDFLEQ